MINRSYSHAQQRNDFRVKVKNFGPILEGDIQIRPLTVFVGPSNTGKSYLAMLIYALHRFFAIDLDKYPYGDPWRINPSGPTDEIPFGADFKENFNEWISGLTEQGDVPLFPEAVENTLRSIVEDTGYIGTLLEREINRCLGVETTGELIRRSRAQAAEVLIDLHQQDDRCGMQYRLGIRRDEFKVASKVIGSRLPSPDLAGSFRIRMLRRKMLYSSHEDSKRDSLDAQLLAILAGMTRDALVSPLRRSAYYLPADRTGVMHSHQVVVSTLIQNAAKAGLRPALGVPTLSGVLADFLDHLIHMASRHGSKGNNRGNSLASRVEETLLGGEVDIDISDANYPHFYYKPEGWKTKLPLMRSSSMVSDLAPMVLYLRHIVKPGRFTYN